jgi:hypothetical protein
LKPGLFNLKYLVNSSVPTDKIRWFTRLYPQTGKGDTSKPAKPLIAFYP